MRLGAAFAPLLGGGRLVVRVHGMVVPVRAIVCVRVILASAGVVMPERHALACHDRSHALERHRKREKRSHKEAE
jgi:hypothetical protein